MDGIDLESPDDGRQLTTIRPNKRSLRAALALSVAMSALVGALAAPSPAVADDNGDTKVGESTDDPQASDKIMSKESLEVMWHQAKFQEAIKLLYAAYDRDPSGGFAGIAFEGDGLTLYYKGEPTSAMRTAVDAASEFGEITVKPAAHSTAELLDAGKRIHGARKAFGASDIQEIGYLPDGSGLIVEKMPPVAARNLEAQFVASGRTFAAAETVLAAAQINVPVEVRTATEVIRAMAELCPAGVNACRDNDYPAWNGGGRFETWRGDMNYRARCTTGFGVWANGYYRVLTAAHCGTPPDDAYQGNSDYFVPDTREYMGPVIDDIWGYDVMLIASPGSLLIFDGLANTGNTKTVVSYGYWAANELVCHSGITSGTVCNLQQKYSGDIIVDCDHRDSDGDCGYTMYGLIRAENAPGQTAARGGDSGGPVFTLMPNISQVRAKGILSAGSDNHMYFQDWDTIDSLWNIYPKYCWDYGCL